MAGMKLRNTTSKRFEFQAQQLGVKDNMGHEGFCKLEWIDGWHAMGQWIEVIWRVRKRRKGDLLFQLIFQFGLSDWHRPSSPRSGAAHDLKSWIFQSSEVHHLVTGCVSRCKHIKCHNMCPVYLACVWTCFLASPWQTLKAENWKQYESNTVVLTQNTVQVFSSACWDRPVILMIEPIIILLLVY